MRIPDKQAVFFEFDGVLVEDVRLDPAGRVRWLPGALDALARVDTRIFMIFVGTAREDIAFGKLSERDFRKFCERFVADCEGRGIPIRKIYSCPYHPKGRQRFRKDSVFRKPAPGLYKIAQQEFDLNLARCWAVGHTTTDVLAGSRAGMGTVLVQTGLDGAFHVEAHRVARDVRDAVAQIHQFELALRC
jgi:D-glycero-D-manno-heptose 1,7-bisphosphate phosphatase